MFTHLNKKGDAHMVDVGDKSITDRVALASGKITMSKEAYQQLKAEKIKKGNVLGVSIVAGIMGAKKTSELIPLCHNINLNNVDIDYKLDDQKFTVEVFATCKTSSNTGVEMEALTAVSVTCLTIYDMCKALDKGMVISDIKLLEKTGGKSNYCRGEK